MTYLAIKKVLFFKKFFVLSKKICKKTIQQDSPSKKQVRFRNVLNLYFNLPLARFFRPKSDLGAPKAMLRHTSRV